MIRCADAIKPPAMLRFHPTVGICRCSTAVLGYPVFGPGKAPYRALLGHSRSYRRQSMVNLPEWQPLDGVAPQGGGLGRVVAIVATEQAVSDGWAAATAVDLVRAWSTEGQRLILVDGGLEQPSLHVAAGLKNRAGLTDAALHGSSVEHVSHSIDDGQFFLVTAGTPVADSNTVVESSRWHRLMAGVAEAGTTLALYVRDGDVCTSAFLDSASDIVILSRPDEGLPVAVRDLEPMVRAVTGATNGSDERSAGALNLSGSSGSTPKKGSGLVVRMIMFVILTMVIIAGLGWFLLSGIV